MDVFGNFDPQEVPTARAFAGRAIVVRMEPESALDGTLIDDLLFMRRCGARPLLVHDSHARDVAARVVGMINRAGGEAVSIDGASASTLVVGADAEGNASVRSVNAQLMSLLLQEGYIPVFCAEGTALTGMSLPVDTSEAARMLAAAMHAVRLLFPAGPGGVPSDGEGIIDEMTSSEALALAEAGTLTNDLRRDLVAAALGVRAGVAAAQLLDLSAQHASIVEFLTARHVGTQIISNVVLSR